MNIYVVIRKQPVNPAYFEEWNEFENVVDSVWSTKEKAEKYMSDADLDSSLGDNHYTYTIEEHEVDKDFKFDF